MTEMKKRCIYLFVLAALLPVLLLRDYTPGNELRYLSIADEALRNGHFFAFSNHGLPYADKPPLYFWLVMAARTIAGGHAMWLLGLFSLLPAWAVAHTMDRWAGEEVSKEYQPVAIWMLLSCGLFLGMSLFLRPDMLMCLFILLSLRTFYRMLKGEGNFRRNALLFPVYLFLGMFSKGPVGLLVPLASTFLFLLWTGRLRTFGRYWGWRTWGILLAGCLLWWGCAYSEGGSEYLSNLLLRQTAGRAIHSFHHREPFYYYFYTLWYAMQPWALLVVGTVVAALCKRWFHSELQKLFLSVVTATFLLLSCVSSKIEVYLLPVYPFFIYLAAMQLSRFRWNGWLALSVGLPALAFFMALPLLLWAAGQGRLPFPCPAALCVAAGLLMLAGLCALYDLYYWKSLRKAIVKMAVGLFCALFAGGFALPELNTAWGYARLCREAVEAAGPDGISGYAVYRIHRAENMDVFLGQEVRFVSHEEMVSGTLRDVVLFCPAAETALLREAYPGCVPHIVGRYAYVCL